MPKQTQNISPDKSVTIYTDGACDPNPGPGGWAAILLYPNADPKELCGAEPKTSNNQMEIQAVLEALKALKEPHQITVYTDSQYLRRGITEWLPQWKQRGWRTSSKKAVKNQALWQALDSETQQHQIDWKWVKGHAGNKWNERADQLATSMLPTIDLPLDDEAAIHIFVAASYLGKEKRGGWGVVLRYRQHTKALKGSVTTDTSANQVHLLAAIQALHAIKKPLPIHLYTPSDYLRDGITRWVKGWKNRGWKTQAGKSVKHKEVWQNLLEVAQNYQINWHLVPQQDQIEALKQAKQLATEAAQENKK